MRLCHSLLLALAGLAMAASVYAQEVTNGGDLITKLGSSSTTLVERMRVTQAGLVGIGITPTQNLEVSGTVSATHFVGDGSSLTGIAGGSSDNITSGTTNVTANNAGYINFTIGTEKMRITNAGAVGIGNSNPLVPLSVSQSNASFEFSGSAGVSYTGPILEAIDRTGTGRSDMNLYTTKAIKFFTGSTEAMRITSGGDVGIGTNSPTNSLTISTSTLGDGIKIYAPVLTAVGLAISNTNGQATLGVAGGTNQYANGTASGDTVLRSLQTTSDTNNLILAALTTSGSISFRTGAIGADTEKMRITNAGLVSIGGNTPAYQLDVSGTARSIASLINGNNSFGLLAQNNTVTNANGSYTNTGLYAAATANITSGITNSGNIIGANIGAFNQSAGNLAGLYGINLSFGGSSGTGTISTAYGIVLTSYQNSGTTTNAYGLFIQDMKATNGYGIYQTGADDNNYFAGDIGIGKIPASNLDVSGSAVIRGVLGIGQPGGSEGGQIALGYIGVVPTAQQASTWNIDVDGSNQLRFFRQNASNVALVALTISETTGAITAPAYYQSSDARLKDNIQTSSGLAVVDKLRGVTFNWKNTGKPSAGVIAQEVEKVLPAAVANDEKGFKSVNYDQLIAPLIESVKELHRDNQKLAQEVQALRTQVETLKKQSQ